MTEPVRPRVTRAALLPGLALLAAAMATACGERPGRSVVVYVSVDQVHAEPLLRRFERESGVRVRAVYDVEAAKTTGLVQRIRAEAARPQADVFWSGEAAQTAALAEEGAFAPHRPPGLVRPASCLEPEGRWSAVGGRIRVLLVNTGKLRPDEYPRRLDDLVSGPVPAARIGLARPLFGTTATHAAALYATRGPGEALRLFARLRERGCRFVDGNSVVRDLVARGDLWVGLTDADDARGALARGAPVAVVVPDQDGPGTFLVAGTAAVLAGAPRPAEAKALVDFLVSPEAEQALVASGFAQVRLGDLATGPGEPLLFPLEPPLPAGPVKAFAPHPAELARQLSRSSDELRALLLR